MCRACVNGEGFCYRAAWVARHLGLVVWWMGCVLGFGRSLGVVVEWYDLSSEEGVLGGLTWLRSYVILHASAGGKVVPTYTAITT